MTNVTFGRRAQGYLNDGLSTASPATLLVMLYDRLVLDLRRGEDAVRADDRQTAHTNLVHAQDIVAELQGSLRRDVWDGAEELGALYTWMQRELVVANISADAERVRHCREDIVEPLAEAWRQAALDTAAGATESTPGVA